ncbi:MAG: integration host factor [Coriobacteriales bacterium]|nr:integration host factor [Coriobacteriales bacterium]
MALPELTDAQRKDALKKAAQTRKKRAALKQDLKDGKKTVKQVLKKADDPIIARMKVKDLISSLPGWGKTKTEKLMEELGIAPDRRIKGLGSRQKEALLERL